VTASSELQSDQTRLPVWRAVAGIAVLGTLVFLLVVAGLVYVDNFRLDRYMHTLAEQPASRTISDAALASSILQRAGELHLPLSAADIAITRTNGHPHIQIGKYTVQTPLLRLDLRLPGSSSR
jgi:hypothetical protein